MQPVRTGLIGYGLSGRAFHAPVMAASPGVELALVASSRPEAVRTALPAVAVVSDVDRLLGDPAIELVVVATPTGTHRDLVERALEAGKHVVVEKPIVTRSGDAAALIDRAASRGLLLSAYHNRRWDGDFLALRELIGTGTVGEVVHFESHFDRFRPSIKAGWREEPREGAGVLYDLGSHLIDQALVLFGMPECVWADVVAQRREARVDDYVHIMLAWGHRRAVLHAGTLVRDPGPRFAVHGTAGSFTSWGLDPQEAWLRAGRGYAPPERTAGEDGRPSSDGPAMRGRLVDEHGQETPVSIPPGRWATYYDRVAAAIRGDGANPVPATQARDVIRVIEGALRSSEEGRRVRLD